MSREIEALRQEWDDFRSELLGWAKQTAIESDDGEIDNTHEARATVMIDKLFAALSEQSAPGQEPVTDGELRFALTEGHRALNVCALFMANVQGENSDEDAEIDRIVESAAGSLSIMDKALREPSAPPVQQVVQQEAVGVLGYVSVYEENKQLRAEVAKLKAELAELGALRHAAIEGYRLLNECAMFMVTVEGESTDEDTQIDDIVERAGGALALLETAINPAHRTSAAGRGRVMFYPYLVVLGAMQSIEEERLFQKAMEGLPEDLAHRLRAQRLAEKTIAAEKAKDERRHQELCDAIRSTSFWRFGGR